MSGVEPGRDVYIKKLEEIISRIEKIIDTIKATNIPDKTALIEDLKDLVSSAEDAIDRIASGKSWSEEVREVVAATTPVVEKTLSMVGEIISQSINRYMEMMDGKRIGENIASLYKSLKEAGMPETLIEKVVKDYISQITATMTAIALPNIIDLFRGILSGKKHKEVKVKKGEDKEK